MNGLVIFLGGGIGSLLRYGIGIYARTWTSDLPLGTFLSNSIAALIIGLSVLVLTFRADDFNRIIWLFIAVGFCGGLSTFSSFSLETVQLFQQGQWIWGLLNILFNVTVSLLLVYFVVKNAAP